MKNRTLVMLVSAILSGGSMALGQAVQPAQAAPPPKAEVFAFTPVGDAGTSAWIGKGIQESLQGQVSNTGASLVMPSGQSPAGTDPVAAAKAAGANLAVVGTFQVNGGQIRANGHVIDVATGNTVGGFSATGKSEDLFKVEDALGTEMSKLLPAGQPVQPSAVQRLPQTNGGGATAPAPATDQVIEQPVTTYLPDSGPGQVNTYVPTYVPTDVPDTYYYPDTYAPAYYYGYGYPYVYGGVGIGIYGGYGYYGRGYYGGYRGAYGGSRYVGGARGGGAVGGHVGGGVVGGHVGGGFGGGGHGGGGHR
jgi:TolB-like protein